MKQFRFPLRFKILITMLLVITTVVSIITFTMANLFHKDKTAYIHNLTSEMATHVAAETEAMVLGYRERLEAFSRIIFEEDLFRDQKAKLLKQLFDGDYAQIGRIASLIYAFGLIVVFFMPDTSKSQLED